MYKALRPTLAVSQGDLWMMSTPYGKRGFFYEAWAHGKGWEKHSVTALDCARIDRAFLEDERNERGDLVRAGVSLRVCRFRGGVFDRDVVERALDENVMAIEVPERRLGSFIQSTKRTRKDHGGRPVGVVVVDLLRAAAG